MQTMTYHMDNLKATAEIQETDVGGGRILAVVSIQEGKDNPAHRSHHTIVFEPGTGKSIVEATKTLVHNLMHKHHLRKPAA